jgi:hypothetical protein
MFFPRLLSSHHKSSLACTITLDGMEGWNQQGEDEES